MSETTTIQEAANEYFGHRFEEITRLLRLRDKGRESGRPSGDDRADRMEERLQEMPLSVDLLTHSPRLDDEWEILLGTGGPADRVLVRVDEDGEVTDAVYQYQDWFTAWTEPTSEQYFDALETVRQFARCFYFGCRYCELDRA